MVNIKFSKSFFTCLLVTTSLLCGFRLSDGARWNINADDPTVWVKFDDEIIDTGFSSTTFRDGNDALEGISDAQEQMRTIIGLIVDDYNHVSTTYARVAIYPTDRFPDWEQNELDSEFDEDTAKNRTIHVAFGSSAALGASGHAQTHTDGRRISSCEIVLNKSDAASAESFKRTLTHEMGHCFGMMHNHNDRNSIMSYSARAGLTSLGLDDKMALTYLYPREQKYAQETPTFGMACSRK